MEVRVLFKDMDSSEAMEHYAYQQIELMKPSLEEEPGPIHITLTITPDELLEKYYTLELRVATPENEWVKTDKYTADGFNATLMSMIEEIGQEVSKKQKKEIEKPQINKRITFRGMEHSDVMEQYANQQLEKIELFLTNERTPIYIDLIFEPSKLREHHRIELRVKTPSYNKISNYEYQGEKFYDTLDRVIDIMYRELLEQKRREIDERKMRGRHDEFKKQR